MTITEVRNIAPLVINRCKQQARQQLTDYAHMGPKSCFVGSGVAISTLMYDLIPCSDCFANPFINVAHRNSPPVSENMNLLLERPSIQLDQFGGDVQCKIVV